MYQSVSLVQQVRLRTQHIDSNDLLQSMGYARPSRKHRDRLQSVLSSPVLGLDQSAFDFRYSAEDFVLSLCKAVGLEASFVQQEVADIRSAIHRDTWRFKPYLFVDTGFKRTTQAIYALAALEHQRQVRVPDIQLDTPIAEQIELAGRHVREHYAESGGDLGIWGTIQRYLFFYSPEQAVALSLHGTLVGEWQGPQPSRAVVSALNACGVIKVDPI